MVAQVSQVLLSRVVLDLKLSASGTDQMKASRELKAVRGGAKKLDYDDTS